MHPIRQNPGESVGVVLTRASVCAADDCHAPHTRQRNFDTAVTISDVINWIQGDCYLPNIAGGKATWIVWVGDARVAVLAQQWPAPRWLLDGSTSLKRIAHSTNAIAVFVDYAVQRDPDAIFSDLAVQDGAATP